jgi:hypothetical protein
MTGLSEKQAFVVCRVPIENRQSLLDLHDGFGGDRN